MPLGVGGRHEGRDAMLRDCWAQVLINYDMAVEADRYLVCAPDEVVVLGSYRGTERVTGDPVDARFAHVLTLRDGHVASLEQITDTRSWAVAAAV
jgi:ketosteroid isomerase-like protein